ncbi:phosphotransferase [Trichloromonas sp.]|uniref:phosphotransferase n=1 Tax=Trichloromonas sp. TaxID=3069249 RepID=UPI003D8157A3
MNIPAPQITALFVRNVILPCLSLPGISHDRWSVLGLKVKSRQCSIFKASHPSLAHPVAIKIYAPDQVKPIGASYQYEALCLFYDKMAGEPTLRVPKPLGFIPEYGAIAMEWIDSPRLRSVLLLNAFNRSRRLELISKAGQWIRHFHEVSGISCERVALTPYVATVERLSQRSQEARFLARNDSVFKLATESLQRGSRALDNRRLPHAAAHADFTPANLHYGGGRMFGIDIWANRRAPVLEDYCRMSSYLALDHSGLILSKQRSLSGLSRSNFDAFFSNALAGFEIDPDLIAYFSLFELLRRYITAFEWSCRSKISWQTVRKIRAKALVQSLSAQF